MRGEKYAYAFALKRKKNIQQIVARYGIEPACWFIQYKQLRPVAQRVSAYFTFMPAES